MIRTPINDGLLQSDLDCAGFDLLNFSGGGGGTAHGIPAGGTTGQSLTKTSNTDYDAGWSTVSGGTGSTPIYTVNVKAAPYSAVGDGVTDDSAAINSAISAVFTAGGGTVFFPEGTYLCNGAFDGTTNSILKIPVNLHTNTVVSIQLLGEVADGWGGAGGQSVSSSIIKSTKTGTGTQPALLAGAAYHASPTFYDFSAVMLQIRNMCFRTYDNPSINALRLESVGRVNLSDVTVDIATGPTIAPTHGTTGVWMPKNANYALAQCNRIYIVGYDAGLRVSEHFSGNYISIGYCNYGLVFEIAFAPSTANVSVVQCPTSVLFTGAHYVDLFLDLEYTDGGGWYDTPIGQMLVDGSNLGSGIVRYSIVHGGVGPVAGPISVTGATQFNFLNLFNGDMRIAGSAKFYIGTDMRLVAVSGGAKLEARNTGTGVWVESARWTNP